MLKRFLKAVRWLSQKLPNPPPPPTRRSDWRHAEPIDDWRTRADAEGNVEILPGAQ